ncbi:MAG TPA: hypothetical protein PLF56_06130 [Micropruina sp.]|jgi:hypothetical protein|nr:hypothetical protein [Micropruina sp.]
MGILLETATHDAYSPYLVGAIVLAVLMIALRVVFGVGKSRPHS